MLRQAHCCEGLVLPIISLYLNICVDTSSQESFCLFLLWQLGAGVFRHAHGVGLNTTSPDALMTHLTPAAEEHCPDHASQMTIQASMEMPAATGYATESKVADMETAAHQNASHTDCGSLQYELSVFPALGPVYCISPYVATALPDSLRARVVATPGLMPGVSACSDLPFSHAD